MDYNRFNKRLLRQTVNLNKQQAPKHTGDRLVFLACALILLAFFFGAMG